MISNFGMARKYPVLYPLSQYLFGLVLGVTLGRYRPFSWLLLLVCLIFFLVSVVTTAYGRSLKLAAFSLFMIWLGIFQLGKSYETLFSRPRLDISYPRRVEGIVSGFPVRSKDKISFDLIVNKVEGAGQNEDQNFKVRASVHEDSCTVQKGQRVRFLCWLTRLRRWKFKSAVPRGGKDYPKFKTSLKTAGEVEIIGGADFLNRVLNLSMGRLSSSLPNNADKDARAVLAGTMWGDKREISRKVMREYKASGLVHILVVSGFNIGLVFAFFFVITRFLLSRSAFLMLKTDINLLSTLVAFWPALFYAFLTGLPYPTLRAVLMLIAFIFSFLTVRPALGLNILFWVGFLMLLSDPLSLFDISFELSLAAVFGIIFGMERLRPLYLKNNKDEFRERGFKKSVSDRIKVYFLDLFSSSALAFLFTVPVSIYYFGTFSPISVAANLVFVPIFSIIIFPLGMIGMILSVLGIPHVDLIWIPDLTIVAWTNSLIGIFAKIPFSLVHLPGLTLEIVMTFYLMLIILLSLLGRKTRKNRKGGSYNS